MTKEMKYRAYTLHNYKELPQIKYLSPQDIEAIEVVGRVLPFKANNYVVEQLIDWNNIPNDPIFTLSIISFIGFIFGMMNILTWFVFQNQNWWMGILHLPLVILSFYALLLSRRRFKSLF